MPTWLSGVELSMQNREKSTDDTPVPAKPQTRAPRSQHGEAAFWGEGNTAREFNSAEAPTVAYETDLGRMIRGTIEETLSSHLLDEYRGEIQLIFTSPPFPLNRKKKYGNLQGEEYVQWLSSLAPSFRDLLKPNGSIVVELGNAWEPGRPVMSALALRTLIALIDSAKLNLCQQFICHNPAKLPSPAQWVNVRRIRVKDSYTHVWWMSPVDEPKADNRRVLKPYSKSMTKLLESKSYNSGRRPSGHNIGDESFLVDNHGAVPSNVLTFSNTGSYDDYQKYCRANKLATHPARMPIGLPEFFINFLTESDDLVLDPFAGSNTTGAASEKLGRRWLSIEPVDEYIAGSLGRFTGAVKESDLRE